METMNNLEEDAKILRDKLWNRNYCKAMIGNFMLFFSFYILTPLLPIYLDAQFAADKDVMGLVLSGYVVAALVVRPFSGFIVDTFDRKKVLSICFFLFFVLFTGYIGAKHTFTFRYRAHPPRTAVRSRDGSKFHGGNRRSAIFTTQRGDRILRTEQQSAMAFAPSVGIWIYQATGNFELLFG